MASERSYLHIHCMTHKLIYSPVLSSSWSMPRFIAKLTFSIHYFFWHRTVCVKALCQYFQSKSLIYIILLHWDWGVTAYIVLVRANTCYIVTTAQLPLLTWRPSTQLCLIPRQTMCMVCLSTIFYVISILSWICVYFISMTHFWVLAMHGQVRHYTDRCLFKSQAVSCVWEM